MLSTGRLRVAGLYLGGRAKRIFNMNIYLFWGILVLEILFVAGIAATLLRGLTRRYKKILGKQKQQFADLRQKYLSLSQQKVSIISASSLRADNFSVAPALQIFIENMRGDFDHDSDIVTYLQEAIAEYDGVAMSGGEVSAKKAEDSTESELAKNSSTSEISSESGMRLINALHSEISTLRENSTKLREYVISLESKLLKAKEVSLESVPLSQEKVETIYTDRQNEITVYKKMLQETESCISVLESEVDYLRDMVKSIVHDNPHERSLADESFDFEAELKNLKSMLDKAQSMRQHLVDILDLSDQKLSQEPVNAISLVIKKAFEELGIDFKLELFSGSFGCAQSSNFTHESFWETISFPESIDCGVTVEEKDGMTVVKASNLLAVISTDLQAEVSLGKLLNSIRFILRVVNKALFSMESTAFLSDKSRSTNALVEEVRRGLNGIKVQTKYQRDEALNILNSLINEIKNCVQGMDLPETKSVFFEQMIAEVKARLEVLMATESVIEDSFIKLQDRLYC